MIRLQVSDLCLDGVPSVVQNLGKFRGGSVAAVKWSVTVIAVDAPNDLPKVNRLGYCSGIPCSLLTQLAAPCGRSLTRSI